MWLARTNEQYCVTTQHLIVTSPYSTFWWTEAKLSLGLPHSMERNSEYPPTNAHPTIFDDHGYLGREYMKLRADHRTCESLPLLHVRWHRCYFSASHHVPEERSNNSSEVQIKCWAATLDCLSAVSTVEHNRGGCPRIMSSFKLVQSQVGKHY